MFWLVMFALIAAAAVNYTQNFRRNIGENVYILASNDRQSNGVLTVLGWVVVLHFTGAFRLDYHGLGFVIFYTSAVAAYCAGQAFTLMALQRKMVIEIARDEVMAGRFHRTRNAAPNAKPAQRQAAPQSPPDPAYAFDPSRFS